MGHFSSFWEAALVLDAATRSKSNFGIAGGRSEIGWWVDGGEEVGRRVRGLMVALGIDCW